MRRVFKGGAGFYLTSLHTKCLIWNKFGIEIDDLQKVSINSDKATTDKLDYVAMFYGQILSISQH